VTAINRGAQSIPTHQDQCIDGEIPTPEQNENGAPLRRAVSLCEINQPVSAAG
jgi:hypothetical protein